MINNIYRTFHTNNEFNLSNCVLNTTEVNLNINLSKFDNLNNLFANFRQLTTLTLLNNYNLGNVQSLNHMFYHCSNLQNLDLAE